MLDAMFFIEVLCRQQGWGNYMQKKATANIAAAQVIGN